jgi:hypothetical protein
MRDKFTLGAIVVIAVLGLRVWEHRTFAAPSKEVPREHTFELPKKPTVLKAGWNRAMVPPEKRTEKEWMPYLSAQFRAVDDYVLWDGSKPDLVGPEYAYEVDWAQKWKEAVGQARLYGIMTGRKSAIILLMKSPKDKIYGLRCQVVCAADDIALFVIKTYKDQEE